MFCDKRSNKVLEFYLGSTILVAGGTGFLGKGLLEKVLRSLDVKKVFMLIRGKGGVCAEDRLEKLLDDRLFDQVRGQVGKVEAVEVDYDLECLGLDDDVAGRLQKDVDVVFYCLADINFNRPLKKAFQTNVQIGKHVLKWCRSFPNLKSVVYTSTFYSECTKNFVEEKIADDLPFGTYKLCMKMLNSLSSETCENIKDSMLGDYPNTYTFTKKLAEIMVQEEFAGDFPIAVYRPSVVSPTYREPRPGWTDNYFGVGSFIRAMFEGVGRVILGDMNQIGNHSPLDYCVNAMLVCGYDVSQRRSSCCQSVPEVTVYNHVSKTNKCTNGDAMRYIAESRPHFWQRWNWKHLFMSTTNKWVYYYMIHLCYWYAGFKDLMVSWLKGANGRDHYHYRRSLQHFASYNQAVAFAMCRSWSSYNKNLINLKRHLSEKELEMFYFDLDDINWPEYFKYCVNGVSQLFSRRNKS